MSLPPPTERQARVIWFALTGLAIATLVALIAALVWGLGQVLDILGPVLWPLAVAGVAGYLFDPVVDLFERKGLSRTKAIICVFGIALLIAAGVLGAVVPPIVNQTRQLIERIPEISAQVQSRVENWVSHPPPWMNRFLKEDSAPPESAPATATADETTVAQTNTPPTAAASGNAKLGGALNKETLQSATGWLAGFLPRAGHWVISWFGILVGLALVPVYAFYLLLEKRGIESSWTNYLPMGDSKFKDEIVFVLRSINGYLIAFFRGQVLVAICDGILYAIGFLIIGVPYAILLGAAAIVLTMIPFLGAIVLCLVALALAFVQYGDWLHPALVLVVFGVVQALEGLVISPKIMGDRVGLHPLTIIIAVMIGTTLLGGLLGGILAIPLTAVLRVLMTRYVWTKRGAAADVEGR